jgi:hypothetical protein
VRRLLSPRSSEAFRRLGSNVRDELIAAGLWATDDERDPSQSIADAWQIVERIAKQWANTDDGGQYHRFVRWLDHETLAEPFLVDAPELALAICKAALAAVERRSPPRDEP